MLVLSQSASRWILAVIAACVLLAWPLHQAQHASEPIGTETPLAQGNRAAVSNSDVDVPSHEGSTKESCLWCMFHASQLEAMPAFFQFCAHAEANPPPAQIWAGLPSAHSALAAHPRGPPAG